MGDAFNAYIQSLRDRTEMEARLYAQDRVRKSQAAMQIAHGIQQVQQSLSERKQKKEEEGKLSSMYKMKARDAGLFQEQPDYVLPEEQELTGRRESILKRRQEVEGALGGMGELAEGQKPDRNRLKMQKELERNQVAFQKIEEDIKMLKDSPDYADQVKAQQWDAWLKKNPLYSETYYRAMGYEPAAQQKADVRGEERAAVAKERQERTAQSRTAAIGAKRKQYIDSFQKQLDKWQKGFLPEAEMVERQKIIRNAIGEMGRVRSLEEVDQIYTATTDALLQREQEAMEAEANRETKKQRKEREKRERAQAAAQRKGAGSKNLVNELINDYGL